MRRLACLALFLATVAQAGVVSRCVKTCGTTEFDTEFAAGCTTIKRTEVDCDVDALTSTINSLDHNNLSATAGILGSQLSAAAGILTGQIQDGTLTTSDLSATAAITTGQLAAGAPVAAASGIIGANLGLSFTTTFTTVLTIPHTGTGRPVIILASFGGNVQQNAAGGYTLSVRLKRDATTLNTWTMSMNFDNNMPLGMYAWYDTGGGAGVHSYTFDMKTNDPGAFVTTGAAPGAGFTVELR